MTSYALRRRERDVPPTAQQLRVLRWLSHGLTVQGTAYQLNMNVNTVKTHLRRLYARLGAINAAHAVRIALARGLLDLDDRGVDVGVPVEESNLEDEVDP